MARGKYLTEYEKETIRIGLAHDVPVRQIAAFMGRTERAVFKHKELMEAAGTVHNLPFDFVAEPLAEAMNRHKVK